ncbi:MAG: lipoate--protein ligase family protein [Halobacteriales archaeon]|nr:lipoate--protein ligase family protein [Halobacteriales archaeon]
MRVLRGGLAEPEADAEHTTALLEAAVEADEPALRVWRPPKQLAFGRRDGRADGYGAAREIAASNGFPPRERRTGGRAVAYTGTTVSFALAVPIEDVRVGLAERYDEAAMAVQRALWRLGVPAQQGEPDEAFCPGNHSLSWRGKVAGLAQRVQRGVALVGGIVVVDGHEAIADVLEPVYAALEVPFDPDTVGSVERAGGRADPDEVVEALEEALVDGRPVEVETVEGG